MSTWCSRAVNRSFPSFLAACRTRSNPFSPFPRLGVRHWLGRSMFSSVFGLPSTASLGGRPLAFGCFVGTMPQYDSPEPFMWGLLLIAFSHRPAIFRSRAALGSLGSRTWSFYACSGPSTPQGLSVLALAHTALLTSGLPDAVVPLIWRFRSSIPGLHIPLSNASSAASRPPSHDSGPGWFAIPFLYDSSIHYSTSVYPDAIRALARSRRAQMGTLTN